MEDVTAIPKPS